MKIACLGWGSLIWSPGDLPVQNEWYQDGPILPIEFARESADGRLTLVIVPDSQPVRSLWALMNVENIEAAKKSLAGREGITEKNIRHSIGFVDRQTDNSHGLAKEKVKKWAETLELDGVVWTNLKFGFKKSRDILPTLEEAKEHILSLSEESQKEAINYIFRAPNQIDTEYRTELQNFCKEREFLLNEA